MCFTLLGTRPPRQSAARSAMKQVLQSFFGGNIHSAVLTLMSETEADLEEEDFTRLSAMIDAVRTGEKPEE